MDKHITFRGLDSSEALKEHVEKKLSRIDKFKDNAPQAHVILKVEDIRHVAEITFSAGHFKTVVESETLDMYASIDEAVSKLQQNIRKHHDKQTKRRTRPAQ